MRYGSLRLAERGYDMRMRIHDEFLALMPVGVGSVKEMVEIISDTPDWAQGLPIAGEGWEGERFRKG